MWESSATWIKLWKGEKPPGEWWEYSNLSFMIGLLLLCLFRFYSSVLTKMALFVPSKKTFFIALCCVYYLDARIDQECTCVCLGGYTYPYGHLHWAFSGKAMSWVVGGVEFHFLVRSWPCSEKYSLNNIHNFECLIDNKTLLTGQISQVSKALSL